MMDQPAPNPYRDGLPPAPPGPPEGEQHAVLAGAAVPFLLGAVAGPVLPLALLLALAAEGVRGLMPTLAALAAGAVLLGLGRYLQVLGATERYAAERRREEAETLTWPERERWEVAAVLHRYGLRGDTLARAVEAIAADPKRWVDFMMRFELDLIEPQPARAGLEALALVCGFLAAGLLPVLAALAWPGFVAPFAAGLAVAGLAGLLLARAEGQVAAGGVARALILAIAGAAAALLVIWIV
jgi:VIT1/CCC1 family predicted Fe2+/Mn2+ transporter